MFIRSLRNFLQSSDSRKTLMLSMLVIVVAVFIGNAIGKKVSGQSASTNQQRKAVLARVQSMEERAIIADNSEQGPLFIQSAYTKEIEGGAYQLLTSSKATASDYVRFPQAKLINNSSQQISQLTVCLVRSELSERTCLRFYDLKLAPSEALEVKPTDWALPSIRMQMKLNEKNGEFNKSDNKADIESDAMWIPGRIADFTIELQSVKFEGNTKWVTKH